MRKYINKALLFSIPILIYFFLIIVVDPYEFINVFHVIDAKDKFKVLNRCDESSPRGNILWKSIHFRRNPVENLIIGDSQGKRINTDTIKALTGDDYFNFCLPGASYETMFNIFWETTEITKLKRVYFQVAFANFNSYRSYDIYHFASDYNNQPYKYFTTKEIFFDTYCNLLYQFTGNEELVRKSYEYEPKEFLDSLSEQRLDLFFGRYEYPDSYIQEIQKIGEYCRNNNIDLNFLIFPSYKKVNEYLNEKGLDVMVDKFKNDIKLIGNTYDYDVPGPISDTRENFRDYFHPQMNLVNEFTDRTWESK